MTTPSFIFVPSVYKQGLIYAELPADGSGDLTVSRGSVATRFNEDGLIELMVRNLCFNSQDWTSNWSANGVTVGANSTGFTAPNGGPTANAIVPTATNAVHRLSSNSTTAISYVSGQVYTASAHFAAGRGAAGRYVQLTLPSGAFSQGGFANFDLVDGTVTLVGGGTDANRSASIVNVGGGWFRCVFTATCNVTASTTGANVVLITAPNDALAPTFLGSTGDLLFGWGAQVEDGRVVSEYQRADTGRFNIPRLDYLQPDGTVGCPALLVEPSGQNWIPQGDNMSSFVTFTLSGAIAPSKSATLSLSGQSNAVSVIGGNGSVGSFGIYQFIAAGLTSGQTVTYSVFAKAGTNNFMSIQHANASGTGGNVAFFDLSNGTTPTANARIENYGNGWYRCIMPPFTFTSNPASSYNIGHYVTPSAITNSWSTSYLNRSVTFYGAQLEIGSVATSFIPTLATAPITRNADVISRTGASAVIGQTEGTIYAEVDMRNAISRNALFFQLRQDASNQMFIGITTAFGGTNTIAARAQQAGSFVIGFYKLNNVAGIYKIAFAYKSTDCKLYVNGTDTGVTIATNNSFTAFSFNEIQLGMSNSANQFNDRIRAAALFTSRLTTEELIIRTAPIYNENLADSIWENYLARPSLSTELPECLRARHNEIITI